MRATLTLIIRGARSKNNSVCSTFGKIRIVLGICFNIWLLYCYGKDLLNGGMYDSDWDYYYHLTPQYFIIVSCCVSLFSDCMLFKKKDKGPNYTVKGSISYGGKRKTYTIEK